MEVAYGKRNYWQMKFRKFRYLIFKILYKMSAAVTPRPEKVSKILIKTGSNDFLELADLMNRVCWGIPAGRLGTDDLIVDVLVSKELLNTRLSEYGVPKNQRYYLEDNPNFNLISDLRNDWAEHYDIIMQGKFSLKEVFENMSEACRFVVIDKDFYSTIESDVWKEFFFSCFTSSEAEQMDEDSKQIFKKLEQKFKGREKAYCFATGPSFDQYENYQFEEDAVKVICNSTVKNKDFLNYIGKPDVLVFADPVFHFGPSEYSAEFRDYVLETMEAYPDLMVCVPRKAKPLLLAHYPILKGRLVGIDVCSEYHFPTSENLSVKGSSNILTLYMLPIASSFAEKIYLVGADGREKGENYFWKHSKTAQLGNQMNSAFSVHPSFFRDRDYVDYYDEHCQFLEDLIVFGEGQNQKKYFSLTKSFIPSLSKRQK